MVCVFQSAQSHVSIARNCSGCLLLQAESEKSAATKRLELLQLQGENRNSQMLEQVALFALCIPFRRLHDSTLWIPDPPWPQGSCPRSSIWVKI